MEGITVVEVRKYMKRKISILAVVFVIIIVAIVYFTSSPKFTADISAYEKKEIAILGLEEGDFKITPGELKELTCVYQGAITGKSKGNTDASFGPLLNTFLKPYGKKQTDFEKIVFTSEDGYQVTLRNEMLEKYDVVLSLARGEEPLSSSQAPMRIYLPGSDSAYWARMVEKIEFVKGEGHGTKREDTFVGLISEDEDTITVVDQAGRTVQVPKKVKSIAICYQVANQFVISLGKGKQISAIGRYDNFLLELVPELADIGTVGIGIPDLELLAELSPDVFIHKVSDKDSLEAAEKLGIPTIAIQAENAEDITTVLNLLGVVLDAKDRADKIITNYHELIQLAKELVQELPEKDKHTAILMGSEIGKVANGSMLQSFMLETAGAQNMALNLDASTLWPKAGTEQIFSWNPDFIFITNSNTANYTVEDILTDSTWTNMKAVQENHVLLMPSALDSWELPGPQSVLGILWMLHKMYPERLNEERLGLLVTDFYQVLYGRSFTMNQINPQKVKK